MREDVVFPKAPLAELSEKIKDVKITGRVTYIIAENYRFNQSIFLFLRFGGGNLLNMKANYFE